MRRHNIRMSEAYLLTDFLVQAGIPAIITEYIFTFVGSTSVTAFRTNSSFIPVASKI